MKHLLGRNVQENAPADAFNLWIIKGSFVNGYNMHNLVCCALQTLVYVIKTHLMLGCFYEAWGYLCESTGLTEELIFCYMQIY